MMEKEEINNYLQQVCGDVESLADGLNNQANEISQMQMEEGISLRQMRDLERARIIRCNVRDILRMAAESLTFGMITSANN